VARRNTLVFIAVLIIFALALCVVLPINQGILAKRGVRLGLDLVGGVHLVYQAQFPEGATGEDKARDMDRALEIIRMRVDPRGVLEPIIQEQEGERILVQLPGFTDIEEAKKLAEQTGFLEFREVELNKDGNPVYRIDYLEMTEPRFFNEDELEARIFVGEEVNGKYSPIAFLSQDEEGNLSFKDGADNPIAMEELGQIEAQIKAQLEAGSPALLSWIPARGDGGTHLTGDLLDEVTPSVTTKPTGAEAEVRIVWTEEGGLIFDQIAQRLYSGPQRFSPKQDLGIFLDNTLISHPWIKVPEYHGEGFITGNFTVAETEHLASLLESGALPMPLEKPPLYEEMISATLGAGFIDMSV